MRYSRIYSISEHNKHMKLHSQCRNFKNLYCAFCQVNRVSSNGGFPVYIIQNIPNLIVLLFECFLIVWTDLLNSLFLIHISSIFISSFIVYHLQLRIFKNYSILMEKIFLKYVF